MIGVARMVGASPDGPRHHEPRHVWQVDVHYYYIGALFAAVGEGLVTIPSTQRAITVGSQHVVEQLHVENVVFDDKN